MSAATTQTHESHYTDGVRADETSLPRFNGDWETKQIGELIHLIPSGIYGLETQTGQLIGMPVATTAHIDLNDRWNEKQGDIRYFTEQQIAHYSPLEGDLIVVKSSGSAASIQSGKIGYVSADKVGSFIFSNFLMLLRPVGCNAQFLFFQLVSSRVKQMLPHLVEASTYPNIRINDYLEIQIPLPPEEEQVAIVSVLSDVDGLIGALDALIAKKRAIKQATMQQLLTGRTRLPGFNGEWETKQIGDVVSLCSEKNNLGTDIPVLTCSKHLGFVDSLIYFKNQVFSKDLSSYKIIRHGQIGYPINHVEEGSIGLQDLYDVALVSPIYVVCSPKECINSFFLHRLLKLDSYRQQFANATTSSINRRGSLRWPAFSKIRVTLPPIAEQVAIATVLSDMETAIATLENRLDKTRDIKQGMMQQLLTGRVRLVRPDVGPQCDYTIKS